MSIIDDIIQRDADLTEAIACEAIARALGMPVSSIKKILGDPAFQIWSEVAKSTAQAVWVMRDIMGASRQEAEAILRESAMPLVMQQPPGRRPMFQRCHDCLFAVSWELVH